MTREERIQSIQPMLRIMARHMAASVAWFYSDLDADLMSEANLAVLPMLDTWDDSRGVSFRDYVKQRAKFAMVDYLRVRCTVLSKVSARVRNHDVPKPVELQENCIIRTAGSPLYHAIENQRRKHLARAVSNLPHKQRTVIAGILGGRQQVDIARELGITESYITLLRNGATAQLRRAMP